MNQQTSWQCLAGNQVIPETAETLRIQAARENINAITLNSYLFISGIRSCPVKFNKVRLLLTGNYAIAQIQQCGLILKFLSAEDSMLSGVSVTENKLNNVLNL